MRPGGGGIAGFSAVTCSTRLSFESVAEKTLMGQGWLAHQVSEHVASVVQAMDSVPLGAISPRIGDVHTCTRLCSKSLFIFCFCC